ncbi:MAG: hypothetical protein QM783_17405 [Phycisphaerales bacterium]
MSQALTRYQSLYLSLRTRSRKEPAPSGLDRIAAGVKLRRATRLLNPTWLREEAERTHELEAGMRGHSERALDAVVAEVREAMMRAGAGVGARARAKGLGSAGDRELVRKALAVIREVARRATGESAYIVQLMGALALLPRRGGGDADGRGEDADGFGGGAADRVAAPASACVHGQ